MAKVNTFSCTMVAIAVSTAAIVIPWAAHAHSWYTGQVNEQGWDCCGGNDCAGSSAWKVRKTADGYDVDILPGTHPQVQVEDRQENIGSYYGSAPVMETKKGFGKDPVTFHFKGNPGLSPDGQVHACITPYGANSREIRCLFLGGLM